MAKKSGIKCTISGTVLTWEFIGTDLRPLTFDAADAPTETGQYAMLHGFKQKIGDAAAIEYRNASGRIVAPTLAEKRAAMADMVSRMQSGEWLRAERSESSPTGLFAALQRLGATNAKYAVFVDMEPEDFREWADAKAADLTRKNNVPTERKAVFKALRGVPEIAAEIARAQSGEINAEDLI